MSLKDTLLTARLDRADVPIDGVGKVTVRALTRQEMINLGGTDDQLKFERKLLSIALVSPMLTEEEVGVWQKNSPANEISAVTMKVNELSGIGKEAEREAYKSV